MAALLPTGLFPGMTADATGITIPYADLPGLTQAEADPATGKGKEVAKSLVNAIVTKYAAIPTADRPAGMTAVENTRTFPSAASARLSYTQTFDVDFSSSTANTVAD
jgi:hypothetical protein